MAGQSSPRSKPTLRPCSASFPCERQWVVDSPCAKFHVFPLVITVFQTCIFQTCVTSPACNNGDVQFTLAAACRMTATAEILQRPGGCMGV